MPKRKYIISKDIDYGSLDPKEILGKKIIDIYLYQDPIEGDELHLLLEDGKQIEISYNTVEKQVMVQSD